jgi:ketosteroid isomerase-like protein
LVHSARPRRTAAEKHIQFTRLVALAAGEAERDTARAMSEENVEIVRNAVERFQATGEMSPETAVEDVAWHDPPDFPDAQVHIGIDGVVNALGVWADAWDDWQIEIDEFVDAGERVLVRGKQRGRGKGTGVLVEQPLCLVYLMRDGKAVEVRAFFDEGQALEAAGLSE